MRALPTRSGRPPNLSSPRHPSGAAAAQLAPPAASDLRRLVSFDGERPWSSAGLPFLPRSARLSFCGETLNLLARVQSPQYQELLERLVAGPDYYSAFRALMLAAERASEEELDHLAELSRRVHGARADYLRLALSELGASGYLMDRAKRVEDPDQRFFIGLLAAAPDRTAVEHLVAERFPDAITANLVQCWTDVLLREDSLWLRHRLDDLGLVGC